MTDSQTIEAKPLSREPLTTTLDDLVEEWREKRFSYWGGPIDKVTVDLDIEEDEHGSKPLGTINLGEHKVPTTERGLEAVARQVGVPVRYLLAIPQDEQQFVLTRRLERQGELFVAAEFNSTGVQTIRKSGKTVVPVEGLLERTVYVMDKGLTEDDGAAWVRDAWFDHRSMRIDALLPDDGQAVLVGIRVSQDRKQNLAPKVQPYLYEVATGVGIEVPAWEIKVEGRNKDEQEVLDEFRFQAERALEHATHHRKSYLDMAKVKVDADRSAHLRRVALDAGLSSRVVDKIIDSVAAKVGERETTMKDFVDLIAMQANHSPESNAARTIQQAAGSLVDDGHTARCKTCHHRLV